MLDEKLLQERLDQFKPEPLIDYVSTSSKQDIETPMVFEDDNTIDLAKANFLNILNNDEIKKTSEDVIREYGVGTCGPRAFYGTTDVHLELEEKLAAFLKMEECIVYSYGFVALSSSIAAYCKSKDVVFVDQEANFPIHQGLLAAKCQVVYFDHNSANSLREEAEIIVELEKKQNKSSRKFLIIEGVSWKTGRVCPLVDFLNVAEDFKMRIFLEETYSVGVFGKHGRGLTEHFNIDPSRIDMLFGTLEAAVGSIGGFCAGSQLTIEHQRLSGSGYIFSASLPTYLVKAAIKSIEIMGDTPNKLLTLARDFHDFLLDTRKFYVMSDPECPFKVFTVYYQNNRKEKEKEIHEYCKENGLHFLATDDGLVINLNVALLDDEPKLNRIYSILRKSTDLL